MALGGFAGARMARGARSRRSRSRGGRSQAMARVLSKTDDQPEAGAGGVRARGRGPVREPEAGHAVSISPKELAVIVRDAGRSRHGARAGRLDRRRARRLPPDRPARREAVRGVPHPWRRADPVAGAAGPGVLADREGGALLRRRHPLGAGVVPAAGARRDERLHPARRPRRVARRGAVPGAGRQSDADQQKQNEAAEERRGALRRPAR